MPNSIDFPETKIDMLDIVQGVPLLHLAAGRYVAAAPDSVTRVAAWVYPGAVDPDTVDPPAIAPRYVVQAGDNNNWRIDFIPAPRQPANGSGAVNTLVAWFLDNNGVIKDRAKKRLRCMNPPAPVDLDAT